MCFPLFMVFSCPLSDPAGDIALGAGILRVGENLACVTVFNEVSEVEKRGFLAHTGGLLHGVGHDHHGEIRPQFVDQFLDLCGGNRVERRTWLVHQQDFGFGGNRACDTQALLLAARKTRARRIKAVLDLIPDCPTAQGLLDDHIQIGLATGEAVNARTIGDVVVDRFRERIGLLKHHPTLARNCTGSTRLS